MCTLFLLDFSRVRLQTDSEGEELCGPMPCQEGRRIENVTEVSTGAACWEIPKKRYARCRRDRRGGRTAGLVSDTRHRGCVIGQAGFKPLHCVGTTARQGETHVRHDDHA